MLMTIAEEFPWIECFLLVNMVLKIFEQAAGSLHCFPLIDA